MQLQVNEHSTYLGHRFLDWATAMKVKETHVSSLSALPATVAVQSTLPGRIYVILRCAVRGTPKAKNSAHVLFFNNSSPLIMGDCCNNATY